MKTNIIFPLLGWRTLKISILFQIGESVGDIPTHPPGWNINWYDLFGGQLGNTYQKT